MEHATPVSTERVESERERWGLGRASYVLFVGTLEPRKNLVRLVRSFLSLSSDLARTRLVLAGAWGWRSGELRALLREPLARSRVVVTGPVGEESLRALYAGAAVFAYPSLYEGFGLPVLEAMASGLPVITSRGGTLEEVAGGAAALVDPTDTSAVSEALERLLRSSEERDRLRLLGRERERCFTWERTASLTFQCYRAAMEQRR
jgi:alpha-1,3-rhamnosyl/mannosyltransferase